MTDIPYQDLERFLTQAGDRSPPAWPPVCLIFGEEMLVKNALARLVRAILGDEGRAVNYEIVEGLNENVRQALERVNTYSLLSSVKVVALTDARIFYSRQNTDPLWERAAKACRAGQLKKAARCFLDILSIQHLSLEDVAGASPTAVLKPPSAGDDLEWVPAVVDYCRQNGLAVPAAANPQQALQAAIEAGFPPGQHLVITTELIDKRRSLYKVIGDKGLVVDCAVAKGDRKADRMAQDTALDAAVADVLRTSGKRMDAAARRALYDLTGFDLRTVAANVEKLVHFTGQRERIGSDDVRQALQRTRRDPLYALTEAVSNRQLSQSLFYLHSLLTGGDFDHPLPLLAAVGNQMRRLLVAKDFTLGSHGRAWRPGCSYPQFQSHVMPAVKAFDDALQTVLETWAQSLEDPPAGGKSRKKTRAIPPSDLFMAGKGRSPFPVYKTLQKAERFTRDELIRIMKNISDADRRLKRSGSSGRMILEQVILSICLGGLDSSPPGKLPSDRRKGGGRA